MISAIVVGVILLTILIIVALIDGKNEKSCYEYVYARLDGGTPAFKVRCDYKRGYHNHREICEKWRKF